MSRKAKPKCSFATIREAHDAAQKMKDDLIAHGYNFPWEIVEHYAEWLHGDRWSAWLEYGAIHVSISPLARRTKMYCAQIHYKYVTSKEFDEERNNRPDNRVFLGRLAKSSHEALDRLITDCDGCILGCMKVINNCQAMKTAKMLRESNEY